MGINTGDSYDAQAKYSPCALPVKKTNKSDDAERALSIYRLKQKEMGKELLFGEITVRQGDMVPCRGEALL